MSRHCRIETSLLALLVAAALFLPAPAFSWGWATHVYYEENLGPGNEESLYGAVLPDFAQVLPQLDYLFFLQHQTHYKFDRLASKSASFGLPDLGTAFAGHNEAFGADHSAHVAGFTTAPGTGGYVAVKSGLLLDRSLPFPSGSMTLAEYLGSLLEANGIPPATAAQIAAQIAPDVAHSVVEDGIDILLVLEGAGPAAGCQVLFSARARDAESVQSLLVKSYARNFAARLKLPYRDAVSVIAGAEAGFQELMTYYGATLCPLSPDQPFQPFEALAALDALRLDQFILSVTGLPGLARPVQPEEALAVLLAVPPLVEADYEAELAETLAALASLRQSAP